MEITLKIAKWLICALSICLSSSFIYGCRKYARHKRSFSFLTATQTLYLTIVAIVFLLIPANKLLYIVWLLPLIFFGPIPYYLQGAPAVLFFTYIFMHIILIGIKPKAKVNEIVQPPPRNLYSTPFSAVMKAEIVMLLSMIHSIFKRKQR